MSKNKALGKFYTYGIKARSSLGGGETEAPGKLREL